MYEIWYEETAANKQIQEQWPTAEANTKTGEIRTGDGPYLK